MRILIPLMLIFLLQSPFSAHGQSAIDLTSQVFHVLDDLSTGGSAYSLPESGLGIAAAAGYSMRIDTGLYFRTGLEYRMMSTDRRILVGTTSRTYTFTHSFIGIPIHLRKEFGEHKFTFFMEGGFMPAIFLRTTQGDHFADSETLSPDYQPDKSSGSLRIFLDLNGGVLYNISSSFKVFIGPTFTLDVKGARYLFDESQNIAGIGAQLGIRRVIQ